MSADELDSATAQIRTVAREWAAAMVSNNPDRIAAFMTQDWVIVSESGIATRDEFLAHLTSGRLTHSAMDEASEPRIRVYNDMAVYTVRATNTAHYDDVQFEADEWTTDVFVRRGSGSGWRCVLSHITATGPE